VNIDQLAVAIEAARIYDFDHDGVTFKIRRPSEGEIRLAYDLSKTETGVVEARAWRAILEKNVKGWSGLTADRILEGSTSDPVEFSAKSLTMLLDERVDFADALRDSILEAIGRRRIKLEEARKNS